MVTYSKEEKQVIVEEYKSSGKSVTGYSKSYKVKEAHFLSLQFISQKHKKIDFGK